MSGSSALPNLLQSRGGRGGSRGFFRRGRGHGTPSSEGPVDDETIQGTDNDAAVSRLSAVELGYLTDDPYAQYFVQAAAPRHGSRRLPIINRGTYTRTTALDTLIGRFYGQGAPNGEKQQRQIISLGAGTDTRPFRLFKPPGHANVVYHELDFPAMMTKKLRTVQAIPALRAILPNTEDQDMDSWRAQPPSGGEYWGHGIDLRQLGKGENAPSSLRGLRTDLPTLLVSECCLCYLELSDARAVVDWFSSRVPDIGIILYEPVKPDDAFGQMMVSNLAARRIRMPTLAVYKQPEDQIARLKEAGFEAANALGVDDIFDKWTTAEERERVDRIEGLDEVEEWKLLAGHYVVAWGWKGRGFEELEISTNSSKIGDR